MPPGILWVSSRIANKAILSPEKLCYWYENIHIPQVTSLPGIPCAMRYQALTPQPSPDAWSSAAPWLTVYEMPDISYRNTAEFKNLDGQSVPEQNLLDGVFKQARFDTRFWEEVQVYEGPRGKESSRRGTFLISAALQPKEGREGDFDKWYREEHLKLLNRAPNYVRSRRYELCEATCLDCFERRDVQGEVPKYLALHEFDGGDLPWEILKESAGTQWAKRVMGNLEKKEVGWYGVKRRYLDVKSEEGTRACANL